MSSLVSDSYFSKANVLRICLWLVFAGFAVAGQTAQSTEGFLAPDPDILTIQPLTPGDNGLIPYRLNANVSLTRPVNITPIESGFGGISPLSFSAKPPQETIRTINTLWQQTNDSDRISLPRLLRFELNNERVKFKFRPRSVSIEGEQLKVTFRPQSALIEGEQLKIMLQPHSALMLWGKAF